MFGRHWLENISEQKMFPDNSALPAKVSPLVKIDRHMLWFFMSLREDLYGRADVLVRYLDPFRGSGRTAKMKKFS